MATAKITLSFFRQAYHSSSVVVARRHGVETQLPIRLVGGRRAGGNAHDTFYKHPAAHALSLWTADSHLTLTERDPPKVTIIPNYKYFYFELGCSFGSCC